MSAPRSEVDHAPTRRRTWRGWVGIIVTALLAVVVIIVGVAGWLTYRVQTDPQSAERMLAVLLGRPVSVEAASLSLSGLTPAIRLDGLTLPSPPGEPSAPRLESLYVVVDLKRSLEARDLRSRGLRIQGLELALPEGSLGVQDSNSSDEASESARGFVSTAMRGWLDTLLAQPELEVRDVRLVRAASAPSAAAGPGGDVSPSARLIASVHARIYPELGQRALRGSATVAFASTTVEAKFSATGTPEDDGEQWSGEGTLTLRDGALTEIAAHLDSLGLPVALRPNAGTVSATVTLNMQAGGPVHLSGDVSGTAIALTLAGVAASPGGDIPPPSTADPVAEPQPYITFDRVQAALAGTLAMDRWQLALSELALEDSSGRWPTTRVDLGYTTAPTTPTSTATPSETSSAASLDSGEKTPPGPAPSAGAAELDLRVDAFRLEHLRALAGPHITRPAVATLVERTSAQGALEAIVARLSLRDGKLSEVHLDAQVRDMDTKPGYDIPGFRGIHGRVISTLGQGRLLIDAPDTSIELPRLYHQVRHLGQARATVRWSFDDQGGIARVEDARVQSASVGGQLDGEVRWFRSQRPPHLRATVRFHQAPYPALAPWLRVRGIPAPVQTWMDRALLGGDIDSLRVSVDASADQLPFAAGPEGMVLEVAFRNADLAFAPKWPQAKALAGKLFLRGPSFQATIGAGRMLAVRARSARISTPDLRLARPQFTLTGDFRADSAQFLQLMRQSPLETRVDALASALKADGSAKLALDLVIDPVAGTMGKVDGVVTLRDNHIGGIGMLSLDAADGELRFDASGLRQAALRTRFLDAPITLRTNKSSAGYRVEAEGIADRAFLERLLRTFDLSPDPQLDYLSGRTAWRTALSLPQGSTDRATVEITSQLRGLGIALPAPLGKSVDARRPTRVHIELDTPDRRAISLAYAEHLGAALRLTRAGDREGDSWSLERGAIRLGTARANMPTKTGLTVEGQLPTLSLDAWRDVLPAKTTGGGRRGGSAWRDKLNAIDVQVGRLQAMRQSFDNVHLVVTHTEGRWRTRIDADEIAGTIAWRPPVGGHASPIDVQLARLRLSDLDPGSGSRSFSPSGLPPIKLQVEALHLGDASLGTLELSTAPTKRGLSIDTLTLTSPDFDVNGKGRWTSEGTRQHSKIELRTQAPRVEQLLSALGLEDTGVRDGQADLHLNLEWPGSPAEFSLDELTGTLFIRSKDGRLVDVKPGLTGRAFGLVNLASLPRALRLDFSHVFGDGFSYDKIEGSFRLASGSAYTNDLRISGPSAKVELAGRTGYVARDYDQLITVTPRVTSSLPLAPLWLAEKVLQTDVVNRVFSTQYTVTGSWDEPKIARIETTSESVVPD